MKTFTYTYRDKSGALKSGTLQEIDRASALSKIKKMGYVPVKIVENLGLTRLHPPRYNFLIRTIATFVGSIVLLLLLFFGYCWFLKTERKSVQNNSSSLITKNKKKNAIQTDIAQTTSLSPTTHFIKTNSFPNKPVHPEEKAKNLISSTPLVINPKLNPICDRKSQTPVISANMPVVVSNVFETASLMEIHLSMLASTPPGEEPLPLPFFGVDGETDAYERDAINGLQHTIVINDTDDEQTQLRKENIAWAKEDIRTCILNGQGSTVEYIRFIQAQQKEAAATRTQIANELRTLLMSESQVDVAKQLATANNALEELGIPKLDQNEIFGEE